MTQRYYHSTVPPEVPRDNKINKEEVIIIIKSFKLNKVPGINSISNTIL